MTEVDSSTSPSRHMRHIRAIARSLRSPGQGGGALAAAAPSVLVQSAWEQVDRDGLVRTVGHPPSILAGCQRLRAEFLLFVAPRTLRRRDRVKILKAAKPDHAIASASIGLLL